MLTEHWKNYALDKVPLELKVKHPETWLTTDAYGRDTTHDTPLKRCVVYGTKAELCVFPEPIEKMLAMNADSPELAQEVLEMTKVLVRAMGECKLLRRSDAFNAYYGSVFGGIRILTYGHRNCANPCVLMGFLTEYAYMSRYQGEKKNIREYLRVYAKIPEYREMMEESLRNYPLEDNRKMTIAFVYEYTYLQNIMLKDKISLETSEEKRNKLLQAQQRVAGILEKFTKDLPEEAKAYSPTPEFQDYIAKKYPPGSWAAELNAVRERKNTNAGSSDSSGASLERVHLLIDRSAAIAKELGVYQLSLNYLKIDPAVWDKDAKLLSEEEWKKKKEWIKESGDVLKKIIIFKFQHILTRIKKNGTDANNYNGPGI